MVDNTVATLESEVSGSKGSAALVRLWGLRPFAPARSRLRMSVAEPVRDGAL